MKTEELETDLGVLYDDLFEHFGLDVDSRTSPSSG